MCRFCFCSNPSRNHWSLLSCFEMSRLSQFLSFQTLASALKWTWLTPSRFWSLWSWFYPWSFSFWTWGVVPLHWRRTLPYLASWLILACLYRHRCCGCWTICFFLFQILWFRWWSYLRIRDRQCGVFHVVNIYGINWYLILNQKVNLLSTCLFYHLKLTHYSYSISVTTWLLSSFCKLFHFYQI